MQYSLVKHSKIQYLRVVDQESGFVKVVDQETLSKHASREV